MSEATKELKRLRDWRDYYLERYAKKGKAIYKEKYLKCVYRISEIIENGSNLNSEDDYDFYVANKRKLLDEQRIKTEESAKKIRKEYLDAQNVNPKILRELLSGKTRFAEKILERVEEKTESLEEKERKKFEKSLKAIADKLKVNK